jgi:ribosomal 50S subunit-recycling heat shock protein
LKTVQPAKPDWIDFARFYKKRLVNHGFCQPGLVHI